MHYSNDELFQAGRMIAELPANNTADYSLFFERHQVTTKEIAAIAPA